jgi:hypothetical protein
MAAIAALAAAAPTPAAHAGPEARALAYATAQPWPALQAQDGAFRGYVPPGTSGRYGEAILGLGLLDTGLREDDPRLVDAALRALAFAVAQDPAVRGRSVFEEYALAAAWNIARRRLPDDPRFQALGAAWAERLRAIVPVFLARPRGGFFNKHVVEAVTWLELARTGLESELPGAILRHSRARRADAIRYLLRTLPRLTRRSRRGTVRLLADPAPSPLAYHALSLGFYARSLHLLGPRHRRKARRVLVGAARASLALAGPDGDVAYTGRSQEQSWALAFTAYGAEVAARRSRGSRRHALAGLATRALARLGALHPVGARGLSLVPALASGQDVALRGLDPYADGSAYTGLTLTALGWSAARGGPVRLPSQPSTPAHAILRARGGQLGVVRTRRVWFAVRRSPDRGGDLRSDFGLVALKVRSGGAFRDVLRLRPRAYEPLGAGPIRLGGPLPMPPSGRRLWTSRRGVTVGVGWARLRWRPRSCGVRLRWRGPRRAAYEYSAFFLPGAALLTPQTVAGGGQRVTVSAPATVTLEPGYVSGIDSGLVRARMRFSAGASGRASVTVCAA